MKYTYEYLTFLFKYIENLRGPDGSSGYIDQLNYTYNRNGNRLTNVSDASGVYNNYDFHDEANNSFVIEYEYDANGMDQRFGKSIASID